MGAKPAQAAKGEQAYTVANYPVDASDKNAVAAKEKALADGQTAAFRALLKRIVPVTAYKQLARVKHIQAAELVSGVAVRSERNSSTEYIANLDFSFQAEAVRGILQSHGIPYVDAQAPAVTVIPVMRQGGEVRADTGQWQSAWSGLDLANTLTPVKLDTLKSVIHADTVAMLANGDDQGLRILAGEYKTDNIVLAIAEPDTAAKRFTVTLAGQDASGPITLKRSYRMADGDTAYASEFAAVVALGVLEGRWKVMKSQAVAAAPMPGQTQPVWSATGAVAAGAGGGEQVRLIAEFASLAQWNEIRTQLLDTPGVEGLEIATVSARNADVVLQYPGGAGALANALGARGLRLMDTGGGWTLSTSY